MQIVQASLDAALGDIIATGKAFDPVTTFVGVGVGIADHGINTVLSDITQATGAMATAKEVTSWSDIMHLDNGCSCVDGPLMTFSPASSSEAQTLSVWFLADAATPTVLKAYGLIQPSVPLPDEFASWNIVLRLCLDPNGQWSAEVTFNG